MRRQKKWAVCGLRISMLSNFWAMGWRSEAMNLLKVRLNMISLLDASGVGCFGLVFWYWFIRLRLRGYAANLIEWWFKPHVWVKVFRVGSDSPMIGWPSWGLSRTGTRFCLKAGCWLELSIIDPSSLAAIDLQWSITFWLILLNNFAEGVSPRVACRGTVL